MDAPGIVIDAASTPQRAPHFYEAGLDVTRMKDPLASYGRFIDRVVADWSRARSSGRGPIASESKGAGVECAVSRWDASGLFTDVTGRAPRDDREA